MLLEILLTRGLVMVVMIMLLELFQKKFILSFYLSFFSFFLFWLVAPSILGPFTFILEHFKILGALFFFFFFGGGGGGF